MAFFKPGPHGADTKVAMQTDEPIPAGGLALSPEEVGARVSAILAAAERDARAVIDAAHREAAAAAEPVAQASEPPPPTLAGLARAVEELRARVEALERGVSAEPGRAPDAAEDAPAQTESPVPAAGIDLRDEHQTAAPEAAARVLAIDLALAGYSRDAIAHELGASMGRSEVDRLLDEVLA